MLYKLVVFPLRFFRLFSALKASNGSGTLIYQTPQGLLLASPTSLVGALTSDASLLASASVSAAGQTGAGTVHHPNNKHNHS